MKRKWIRSLMTGLLVVGLGVMLNGVGLEGGGGTGLLGELPEDPVLAPGVFCSTPEVPDADEWCKYVRTVQNLDYIAREVEAMAFFTRQYPQTYGELGQSIYACVRSQDLTNPYSGQPVQEEATPSPGNVRWTYNPQTKDLLMEIAYILDGQSGFYSHLEPGSMLNQYDQEAQQGLPYPVEFPPPDASENVKRSWVCGWLLDDYIGYQYPVLMATVNYDGPHTFAEMLRRFPVLKKMWNPFQNRFIQEVPMEDGWATPHPGDISYTWISEDTYEFYVWGEGDWEKSYGGIIY